MISFLVVVVLQWLGAALGLVCTAQPLEQRQSSGSPFSLYAYGNNINGLEVFYADGEHGDKSVWLTADVFNRASSNRRSIFIKRDEQSANV